jgi:hypothetical protein
VSINGHPVTQSQSVTRYAHDTLARDTVVLQNWPTLPTPCQAARPLSNIYVPRRAAQALGANRTQTDPRPTPYQPQPTPTDPAAEQVKYMYTRECLHEWFFSPEQPLAIRGYMVVVDPEHPHVYSRAFGSVCTSGCSHLNHARSDGMSHYRPPPVPSYAEACRARGRETATIVPRTGIPVSRYPGRTVLVKGRNSEKTIL